MLCRTRKGPYNTEMLMKSRIFIMTWAAMALSCSLSRAQDTNRVPDINQGVDAIDPSVQADVEEPVKEKPQPSEKQSKRPTTYSRWSFQSPGQPPATRFWPIRNPNSANTVGTRSDGKSLLFHAETEPPASTSWPARGTDPTVTLPSDGNSGKPRPRHLDSFSVDRAEHTSRGRQPLKTTINPTSQQPELDRFSAPFHEKQFGLTGTSPILNSFPKTTFSSNQGSAKAKQHKRLEKKPVGSIHTDSIDRISNAQRKLRGSEPTSKPE
jgi:hypothetical protein